MYVTGEIYMVECALGEEEGFRGVFRALSNICDEAFRKISSVIVV